MNNNIQQPVEPVELIRKRIGAQRKALLPQMAAAAAAMACQNLLLLPEFSTSDHIAAYLAVNGEIDTGPLIQAAWLRNKRIYLPVLQSDGTLLFAGYTPGSRLQNNRYRIPEPEINPHSPPLSACDMDILIAPLVAFDHRCQRIGMGAGYYDRTLAGCGSDKPVRIGFAYEFQHVPAIDGRDWDIPMHKIVTESRTYTRSEKSG